MALKKSMNTQYGVKAQHWVISKISIDRLNLSAEILLAGYASRKAEEEKQIPLIMKNFYVKFSENPQESVNNFGNFIPEQAITPELLQVFESISNMGYNYIRMSEEFGDAEDV